MIIDHISQSKGLVDETSPSALTNQDKQLSQISCQLGFTRHEMALSFTSYDKYSQYKSDEVFSLITIERQHNGQTPRKGTVFIWCRVKYRSNQASIYVHVKIRTRYQRRASLCRLIPFQKYIRTSCLIKNARPPGLRHRGWGLGDGYGKLRYL